MRTRATATFLVTVAAVLAGCTSALPTPSTSRAPIVAGPLREPAHLAQLPQEQAVLDAFAAGGLTVGLIGGSKSEGQLGRVLPARVFNASEEQGTLASAAVLFLPSDGQWAIRVCETPSTASGRFLYEIHLNGVRVGGSDAARRVHYLVNDRFFVIAYADRSADALRRGLGLSPAAC